MDASASPVSSNVTVEYTDPSGVFKGIEPLLSSVLPLRNLHWKSPTRPLRSIDSLHVDFIPAQSKQSEQYRQSDHRRHQIPGLRHTPYVKIYLLRCDDNDTYKNISRKLLRDWIKDNASASQTHSSSHSSSAHNLQDNHDAFEWLIVHVTSEGIDVSPSPASKWTGRASTSVLEKVRADFNGSSKSAVDRVAQLKTPRGGWVQRRTPEQEAQVEDLVLKLKFAILTAFSLRISQYEEDIREKDSQRSLPGWNFCTFFMLKEGLVLGFEHVGLYDDALVGYDELSVGLDSALRDQGVDGQHHATSFLEYNTDIVAKAEEALEAIADNSKAPSQESPAEEETENASKDTKDSGTSSEVPHCIAVDREYFPLDFQKKQYREMILANDISVFDFKVYIFARQMTLLLKSAKARPGKQGLRSSLPHVDLTLLAELCERASEFISIASRTLRSDLRKGLSVIEHACSQSAVEEVIDNIVSSWTYAAVSQVLTETTSALLDVSDSALAHNGDKMAAAALAAFVAEARPDVPKRASSLPAPGIPSPLSPGVSPAARRASPIPSVGNSPINRTGSLGLAAARGDLFLLARRVLDAVGKRRSWSQRWNGLSLLYLNDEGPPSDMEEVSLDNGPEKEERGASTPCGPYMNGLELPILVHAASSSEDFNGVYEDLTDQIFRHYFSAGRIRSSEMALCDLALVRFNAGDYNSAVRYFEHLTHFYGTHRWHALEGVMLELQARSLQKLGRDEEYVKALLKLLANYAGAVQSGKKAVPTSRKRQSTAAPLSFTTEVDNKIKQYVNDLVGMSDKLSRSTVVPLLNFFGGLTVSPVVSHNENKDGMKLQISLRFLLGERVEVKRLQVHLVDPLNPQTAPVCFECPEDAVVKSTPTRLLIETSVSLHGRYVVDRIEAQTGNLVFLQDYHVSTPAPPRLRTGLPEENTDEEEKLFVLLYPPKDGLDVKVTPPHRIDLADLRTIDIELRSGQNDIIKGTLRVKPATAGLRLRVANAAVIAGDAMISFPAGTNQLEYSGLKANSLVRINIPYSTETNRTSIAARVEVSYTTEHGDFSFLGGASVISTLPISVNVQDVFQNDVLLSRYTISPNMMTPIRVLDCRIPSSTSYDVQSSLPSGQILDVFPKQPASLLYKTYPTKARQEGAVSREDKVLALTVKFTCLDEESLYQIERKFVADIAASSFGRYAQLLTPQLIKTFSAQWTAGDLETIGLLREVDVMSFEHVNWSEAVGFLDRSVHEDLIKWLQQWHKDNKTIPLDPVMPDSCSRTIVIPVDVPEVQVVHTATLDFLDDEDESISPEKRLLSRRQVPATVGELITAKLRIRHTRRWSHPEQREPQSSLEFTYEILANPDVWVIGGRRRGNFTSEEDEDKTFDVFLLPQRSGHLLVPNVEVKSYVVEASQPDGTRQRRLITSEVDYRDHAETILVSPNYRKTTFNLSPTTTGLNDSGWLVESERRTNKAS